MKNEVERDISMAKNNNRGRRNSWARSNNNPAISNPPGSIEVNLPPPPPDDIFRNRANRANPSQTIWGGDMGTISYLPERIEYKKGEGNFVYYVNCPYPSKCVAPAEAIYAINPIKREIISIIRILTLPQAIFPLTSLFLMGKKRRTAFLNECLKAFNETADMSAYPYYLEEGYYCKLVKEIQKGIKSFLIEIGIDEEIAKKTGEIIGMLFEYDNAYRYPLHDALNESSKEAMLQDLAGELQRLIRLISLRDNTDISNKVVTKFEKGIKLIKYSYLIPSLKKAIESAIISINWDNVKLDEADIYHTLLYSTYDIGGKTLEERLNIYRGIHGEDMTKWPPRVLIRSK